MKNREFLFLGVRCLSPIHGQTNSVAATIRSAHLTYIKQNLFTSKEWNASFCLGKTPSHNHNCITAAQGHLSVVCFLLHFSSHCTLSMTCSGKLLLVT